MSTQSTSSDFSFIKERIQNLYKYRDEFYLLEPKDKYADKQSIIEAKIKGILEELNNVNETAKYGENKAEYYYLKGWLLNIKESYDEDVFESLTKFIKFNPEYEDAWLELGECYFKQDNLKQALDCFEKVIKINPNEKRALRNASIMLRSIEAASEQKQLNILKSIDLANKAVKCDLEDKDSWAILGNAYLTLLFMSMGQTDSKALLNKCRTAYQKALLDKRVKTKSDVLFNYSTILLYEEEFEMALECLSEAYIYDPSWNELKEKKENLINSFEEICKNKIDKTVIKAKELTNIKEELKREETKLKEKYKDDQKLCNGHYMLIEDLKEGFNECLLVCKILSYVADNRNIFFCSIYYLIDSKGHTITLFIHDLAKNKGPKPGDLLLIVRPFLKEYRIKTDNNEFRFKAIRLEEPLQNLIINNKRITSDCLSIPIVNVTIKTG